MKSTWPASSRRRVQALRDLADEDLMRLVPNGDALAFEVVFDRHQGVAFSLAYRICADRAAAEEVCQEAFLALWRSGARYDSARGSVRTWILGIVHNRAIDAVRRAGVHDRRRSDDEGAAEALESPEHTEVQALRHDEARTVRAVLDDLPDEQARVIELAYFGGFTHSEIAEVINAPLGTVKGRMRLGLEKMRLALGSEVAS